MMLLIGLAITVAFVSSWGAALGLLHHELDFWWELALLIVIMLLGHWIEMRALAQTSSALDSLAALLPDTAERVESGRRSGHRRRPADLHVGDVVLVRPGGSVPPTVASSHGAAEVDESMVTGESRPVPRGVGDPVVAGTVATDSGIRVEVTAVGGDTALAGIQRLVAEAQNSSSRAQRLADRAAGWLFWFALGAAIVTAAVWGFVGLPQEAVIRTITVLVIACPHALGLAIPLVVSIATERAARGGVLVKDRMALETHAHRRRRAVRQDRHPDQGRACRDRDRRGHRAGPTTTCSRSPRPPSPTPNTRWPAPSSRPPAAAASQAPAAVDFTSVPAVGVTAAVGGRIVRVGGPPLLAEVGRGATLPASQRHGRRGLHRAPRAGRRRRGGSAGAGRRDPRRIPAGRGRRCNGAASKS